MAPNTTTVIIGNDPEKVVLMLEELISVIKKHQGITHCEVQSYWDINSSTLHTTIFMRSIPSEEQHG